MTTVVAGREITLGFIVKTVSGLAILVGVVITFNAYYATASDVNHGFNTMEQAMIDIRLDVVRDRKYQEMTTPVPDAVQIERYRDQIRRMEERQNILQQQELESQKGWW